MNAIDAPKNERDLRREFQDLAYLIVHHLKEPVRSIRTGAELLLENVQQSNLEIEGDALLIRSSADCLLRGASRVDEIATSIAQYADDLGDEDEPMEPVNTEAVLRALRQKLKPLIEQTQAAVTNDSLPRLECQPTRFSRLMEHLVRNAIVYRREPIRPSIHISAKRDSAHWLFSIVDNGIGIAPPYLDQVFDPFCRLHAKQYHGLGMGLTTCRKIVTRHGGRIWLESEVGVGSTVFFTLPG
jgi:light-regulated signal transduction histidine kinase (bacteriophytochrome)